MPDSDPSDYEFDTSRLVKMTNDMILAITAPPFVEAMRQLRDTPIEQRLAQGAALLKPDALREAGVPLPPDMRISSRYFEPGKEAILEVNDDGASVIQSGGTVGKLVVSRPLEWGGCACGGGLTFCGGAGGSSFTNA